MDKQEIYESLNKSYFSENMDEKDILSELPKLLEDVKVFVDVGASLGQYTYFASRCLKNARMFAIEADPIRFEELERNCARWAKESGNDIKVIHAAVSDSEGPITFFSTQSNVSGGLFVHPVKSNANWSEITVPGNTLDNLVGDASPDFVKVDVEGAELRLLKGAEKILRTRKCRFLLEVHSWTDPQGQKNPQEVYDFLASHSYSKLSKKGKLLFVPKEAESLTDVAKRYLSKVIGNR